MFVAVPYDFGSINQHFGRTREVRIYEVENGEFVSAEVVEVEGGGHDAVCDVIFREGATVVICGKIGSEAVDALVDGGVEVFSGIAGDADEAVEAYLAGDLNQFADREGADQPTAEANCNCAGDDEDCGCGCGGSCGSGCGGCSGGCGGRPMLEGPNAGKTVRVHYTGTFNNGTKFDSSLDRGEALEFICGIGQMIPGFDAAVVNMEVGQKIKVHLTADEAYGMPDPRAFITANYTDLPGSEDLEVGQEVMLTNIAGQSFPVRVLTKGETTITFDANHELAGQELNFEIELLEVLD